MVIDSLVGELARYEAMAELKIGGEADRAVARTLATQIRCLLLSLSHEAVDSSRTAIAGSTGLLLATCLAMQDSTVRLEEAAGLLGEPRRLEEEARLPDQPARDIMPQSQAPLNRGGFWSRSVMIRSLGGDQKTTVRQFCWKTS